MPLENRNLEPGTVLSARYKKQDRTCEVVETPDGVRFRLDDGTEHKSPSSAGKAAMDGVMNERTINVSNSRPNPMVVPTCPITIKGLNTKDAMVAANTRPADVTTAPVPAIERMIPVRNPAWISSLKRETNSRL